MDTKILVSLLVIGLTAVAIGGAMTGAFFSDTETSKDNTFAAGEIDLKIDSQCTYNGEPSRQCGTWELKDLNPTSDKFFNFVDIKPGDFGENTISLHVYDNDAWVCAAVSNLANADNGCNEPESEVDTTCGKPGVGEGELQNYLTMTVWRDTDCDNILDKGNPFCSGGASCDSLAEVPCNEFECTWIPGTFTPASCTGDADCTGMTVEQCNAVCKWDQADCSGGTGCGAHSDKDSCESDECTWDPADCSGDAACTSMTEDQCKAACTWNPETTTPGSCSGGASCDGLDEVDCNAFECTWNTDGPGEVVLASGTPVNGILPFYDASTKTGPLKASNTVCLGVEWKLPAETGNIVQTDSLTGDISFYAVQSRNNLNYFCIDDHVTPP